MSEMAFSIKQEFGIYEDFMMFLLAVTRTWLILR